jgi:glutamate/tyrosine decarboxylase-like PLP-dependent enzyme
VESTHQDDPSSGSEAGLLAHVATLVAARRAAFAAGPVHATATLEELRAALDGPTPEAPTGDDVVIADLAAAAAPGLLAIPGPRYFGFVIGGSQPAALAADWLTSGWDNNAGIYAAAPAAAVIEEVAGRWIVDLLGLPAGASVGFATGATMASFTGLGAARHRVLADAGWDVERQGLRGAPPVRIVAGEERHTTIDVALRYLGFGTDAVEPVAVDDQGRMRADALRETLVRGTAGPTIVCAQAGNVNTGAFDPLGEVCDATHAHGGWVHVDGAFGLWAAVADDLRHLVAGAERADSWSTDGHKWLNVPYDCGIVVCRDVEAHRASMSTQASYLVQGGEGAPLDPFDYVPEFSRRARGIPVYAVVRALGRSGIAARVAANCAAARRFASRLGAEPDVEVLNDVVLNQVLVRFGDSDERTRAVIDAVQRDGTAWMGGTVWKGVAAMRISVSNWTTTDADVDASVDAILRIHRALREQPSGPISRPISREV